MSPLTAGASGPVGDPRAFRLLRDKLLAGPWGTAVHRALAVVSVHRGDGRSYVCASLAVSLGRIGRRTLLIDADPARPTLHRLFGADNGRGVSDVLLGAPRATCIHPLPAVPRVSLLPGGPPAPANRLQAETLAELVQASTREFDHVILDTPPADEGPQALAIAVVAGFALVLGRGGPPALGPVQGLIDSLVNAGVEVTGVVIDEH